MNRTRALPTVLEILDDGLRLYRRNLSGFTLVATAVLVVVALLALLWSAFVRTQLGDSWEWTLLLVLVMLMLGYPLILYTFAALSRATASVLDGQPIRLPAALWISPGRGCGMIVFNLIFGFIASICTSMMSFTISCPMLYLSALGSALVGSLGSNAGTAAGVSFALLMGQVSTLWSLISFGGWLVSIVYALQTFVLERHPWSVAVGRSVDFLTARFGRSLLMFLSAGAIFGTLSISYLGSLLMVLVLAQERFGLELPAFASDALMIVITVVSLVVLLPPLSIWMTMFYRHIAHEQDGEEIARQVAAWHAQLLA